jgi:hypothetical protein
MPESGGSSGSLPPDEDGWNLGTYRQYLDNLDDDCRRWSLPWVQICLFKVDQPPGFEMFRGRLAALGIDRLGLDSEATVALLEAMGGEGARIPSTPYILRVVRPWHALIEEKPSPTISLPANWLEGLELWEGQQRIWIGRKVVELPLCPAPIADADRLQVEAKKKFDSIDCSLYEEITFGWKLREAPYLDCGTCP